MPEEIKQKDKLKDGFEDLVINDTGKNFDDDMFIIQDWWLKQFDSLLSQALQKRDEEWQELIPILKKQGAWDKTNEQILENLEKIGKKDFAKLLTLTN